MPGLPSGVSAKVLSLRGAGAGESEINLRRLVPGSAREELETDVSFAIVQGQSERVMSLTAESRPISRRSSTGPVTGPAG